MDRRERSKHHADSNSLADEIRASQRSMHEAGSVAANMGTRDAD